MMHSVSMIDFLYIWDNYVFVFCVGLATEVNRVCRNADDVSLPASGWMKYKRCNICLTSPSVCLCVSEGIVSSASPFGCFRVQTRLDMFAWSHFIPSLKVRQTKLNIHTFMNFDNELCVFICLTGIRPDISFSFFSNVLLLNPSSLTIYESGAVFDLQKVLCRQMRED